MADEQLPIGQQGKTKTLVEQSAGVVAERVDISATTGAGASIANSATVLGATTGAAVTTDADGTIQRYLRGIVTILGAVTASPVANTIGDRLKALLTGIVLAAGTNLIGKVGIDQTTEGTTNRVRAGGTVARVSVTPVVTAGAYSVGDAVGGKMTFASAVRTGALSGILHAITVVDLGQQLASLELVLFDRDFTAVADNAVFDPVDGEMSTCLGVVPISAGDYSNFNDNAIATVRGIGLPILANTTSLFGQLVSRGTAPTYVSTSDVIVTLEILQD